MVTKIFWFEPLILMCSIYSSHIFVSLNWMMLIYMFMQSLDLMLAMHCPFSMHYQSVILCVVCMFDIWLNSAQKKALPNLFIHLGKTPSRVTERHIDVLEAYILEVCWSLATKLAAALYDSFKSANNDLCYLLPSKYAFHQHLLGACYQTGY